jgi:peptidoglycan/xylan/chitin deacetylase (PgdA/CDA1 family)
MYHALSAARSTEFQRGTPPAGRFEAHLDYLCRSGYRSITVADLAERYRHTGRWSGERLVVLTFDDVYADGEGEGDRPILSWAALEEIARSGIEVAEHSHSHPEMDRLAGPELARQARMPKAVLEDRPGIPVRSFVYPYGRYDRRVRAAVTAAGYRGACTPIFHGTDAKGVAERMTSGAWGS